MYITTVSVRVVFTKCVSDCKLMFSMNTRIANFRIGQMQTKYLK
jgi:hypothetical protein